MATVAASPSYTTTGAPRYGIMDWLTTVDHKKIGTLYLHTALFFFVVGGVAAIIMRAQLIGPNGKLVSAEVFNQLFTMHGTTMVFLVSMPPSGRIRDSLSPRHVGALEVACPRLNDFGSWVDLFGGLFIPLPIFFHAAPDGGWFAYTPLSGREYSLGQSMNFWVLGIQIL